MVSLAEPPQDPRDMYDDVEPDSGFGGGDAYSSGELQPGGSSGTDTGFIVGGPAAGAPREDSGLSVPCAGVVSW